MAGKITDKIYQDLYRRLCLQDKLPFRLTLSELADFYQVSLTPIREVVQRLLSDGALEKLPNGRLKPGQQLDPEAVKKNASTLPETDTQTELLEKRVSDDVMTLSLRQSSDYLREEASARKYQVGRTVIRQVFSRLAGQGLLQHVPRCGWRVIPFQTKDMLDYLEIREMLEIKALELAWDKLDHKYLRELLKKNQQASIVQAGVTQTVQLDDELHHHWIERCDNRYIQDFFQRHAAFYSALFDFAALGDKVRHAMADEHCEILEAILAHDKAVAIAALTRHIRDQKANVQQLVDRLDEKTALKASTSGGGQSATL